MEYKCEWCEKGFYEEERVLVHEQGIFHKDKGCFSRFLDETYGITSEMTMKQFREEEQELDQLRKQDALLNPLRYYTVTVRDFTSRVLSDDLTDAINTVIDASPYKDQVIDRKDIRVESTPF
ncbi:hypothetical protein IMZ31_23635 (plasmid) [Pontibacillus sp. ALD_SL1]|uniref:hypothetical protein n=1 Tax=Pontibacillus sp. ALD_SL1 TaxID=2777185 RepID=UPI001A957E65|nr:hypothetical protein [Pontibacillus sp. ALD_SL1]QST02444.1 hypothetical protein IMZ31_23635 [Pontibacillus sp. ALD_SL1]